MSFWDNVKKFAQPYADDEEYDDYDEEVDGFEEEETEEPVRRSRRRSTEETSTDFGFGSSTPSTSSASAPSGFNGTVLNVNTGNKQEVILFRPSSFNDTSKAADDLRNKKAVVVNMENVDKAMARRGVDFLSGCAYALDGKVKKIAQSTYLFCPHNMDVVGDLESLNAEAESYM